MSHDMPQTIRTSLFSLSWCDALSPTQSFGWKIVMRTDMMLIGMLSRAKKAPSIDARGPLKPSLSSATRQMDRISKQAAATVLPVSAKRM